MKKVHLNPWIAAILNALIPGSAYVLMQRRVAFGWLMLVSSLSWYLIYFVDRAYFDAYSDLWPESALASWMLAASVALFIIAFASDAYKETRR